jgi:hypothetical protein
LGDALVAEGGAARQCDAATWARFLDRYPRYAAIGALQAVVLAFATDALVVAFLLLLGADAAFATLVGILPVAGSAAQALLPGLLRRIGGNIGGLTVALTLAAETRGLWLALAAAGWATGSISTDVAIAVVAGVAIVGGSAGMLAQSTLLAWMNVLLPDAERRIVLPRLMGLAMGASGVLLVPAGLVLNGLAGSTAAAAFALLFAVAGIASVALVVAVRGLPRPPVHVPPARERPAETRACAGSTGRRSGTASARVQPLPVRVRRRRAPRDAGLRRAPRRLVVDGEPRDVDRAGRHPGPRLGLGRAAGGLPRPGGRPPRAAARLPRQPRQDAGKGGQLLEYEPRHA